METRPKVSVVISTYQRADRLPGLVTAFERQTLPVEQWELVIVDNGSTDETSQLLNRLASSSNLRITPVRIYPNQGSSAGRNAGWKSASGDVIAFTDDDCIPDPDWLRTGLAAMDEPDVVVVQGRTLPQRRLGVLERAAGSSREDGLFPTCNVFYRRLALQRAGGFDRSDGKRLGFAPGSFGRSLGFGEDTLLGWRVARSGRRVYERNALVRHEVVRPRISEYVTRYWLVSGFPALVREAPELRTTLLRRRFFLDWRRLPLYALLMALLARSPRISAAAATWWLAAEGRRAIRRSGRLPHRLAAIPVEMAVDVITAIALSWGSARTRSVVL